MWRSKAVNVRCLHKSVKSAGDKRFKPGYDLNCPLDDLAFLALLLWIRLMASVQTSLTILDEYIHNWIIINWTKDLPVSFGNPGHPLKTRSNLFAGHSQPNGWLQKYHDDLNVPCFQCGNHQQMSEERPKGMDAFFLVPPKNHRKFSHEKTNH